MNKSDLPYFIVALLALCGALLLSWYAIDHFHELSKPVYVSTQLPAEKHAYVKETK